MTNLRLILSVAVLASAVLLSETFDDMKFEDNVVLGSALDHEEVSHLNSRVKRQTGDKLLEYYEECGGDLGGATGHFYTPYFPYTYPNNSRCTWTITVPPPYTQIKIDFIPRVHMEDSFNYTYSNGTTLRFCWDSFAIHDGPSADHRLMVRDCGLGILRTQISTSNKLTVVFKSDSSIAGTGFLAIYAGLRRDGTTNCVEDFTHGHSLSGQIQRQRTTTTTTQRIPVGKQLPSFF